MKRAIYVLAVLGIICAVGCMTGCGHKPSKVEIMRQEKAVRDSIKHAQAQQNVHYSDSLLQVLLPQVDPLLQSFVYSKNDKAEDHGHYVHRLLQTTVNTSRNFLQSYVADNRQASVQSYYYGARACKQTSVRLSVGEDYIEKEGSNHAFEAEGWHEIMTIEGDDAVQILGFLSAHSSERVCVQIRSGSRTCAQYVLTEKEKEALRDTYRLAVLMRDIDALERAIHVAERQKERLELKVERNLHN